MAKKQKKLKSVAVLTVFDAANFSRDGKRRIVAWLRRQAAFIAKHAGNCSPRFRARYLCE